MKLTAIILGIVAVLLLITIAVGGFALTYKAEHSTNQKLFNLGTTPQTLPEGLYNGSINFPLAKNWKGVDFDATASSGVNVFKTSRSYSFKTYISEGLRDKDQRTFKIDYNVTQNPFWLKPFVEELVEVESGKYLGKIDFRIAPFLPFTLSYFRLETANPKAPPPPDYQIVLLGDSMTERLGNSDELMSYLKNYYPGKVFLLLNYGYGSTNILSVEDRLNNNTYHGRVFQPILNIDFDLILIESFGNNPLSQYPLQEGLQKQNQALDKIIAEIKEKRPKAKIAFVATIAPNSKYYAIKSVDLSPQKRKEWVDERKAYIKNHIDYAHSHSIPVIDIFDKSFDDSGDGNLDYISTDDYIHPSPKGIYFISEAIAQGIYENNLLSPK